MTFRPRPRMRTRKRTLLMVLLLLTGGAIVNVAVAWGFSMNHQRSLSVLPYVSTYSPRTSEPPQVVYWHKMSEESAIGSRMEEFDSPSHGLSRFTSGWPTKSLLGEFHHDKMGPFAFAPHRLIVLSDHGYSIPIVPIWPGFAINTVFYAAVLWLFFAGPGFVRRRIRARSGLCPACGYQIAPGTGDVCSECGALLPLPLGEGRGEGKVREV